VKNRGEATQELLVGKGGGKRERRKLISKALLGFKRVKG
jgi:hypothetical protein